MMVMVMVMKNNAGATRSDETAITDGKLLPAAGTSVQARGKMGKDGSARSI